MQVHVTARTLRPIAFQVLHDVRRALNGKPVRFAAWSKAGAAPATVIR